MPEKSIVITELADSKRYLELAWQCHSDQEAVSLVEWLGQHGIKAKAVPMNYCNDWVEQWQ